MRVISSIILAAIGIGKAASSVLVPVQQFPTFQGSGVSMGYPGQYVNQMQMHDMPMANAFGIQPVLVHNHMFENTIPYVASTVAVAPQVIPQASTMQYGQIIPAIPAQIPQPYPNCNNCNRSVSSVCGNCNRQYTPGCNECHRNWWQRHKARRNFRRYIGNTFPICNNPGGCAPNGRRNCIGNNCAPYPGSYIVGSRVVAPVAPHQAAAFNPVAYNGLQRQMFNPYSSVTVTPLQQVAPSGSVYTQGIPLTPVNGSSSLMSGSIVPSGGSLVSNQMITAEPIGPGSIISATSIQQPHVSDSIIQAAHNQNHQFQQNSVNSLNLGANRAAEIISH